jgi:hypothetical protein
MMALLCAEGSPGPAVVTSAAAMTWAASRRRQLPGQVIQVGLGALAGDEERLLHGHLLGHRGAGRLQRADHPTGDVAVGARRGHHHDPPVGQQPGQQRARRGLGEGLVIADLLMQVAVVAQQRVDLLFLLLGRLVEHLERGGLQRRRTDHDANGKGQEHRDDGDEVISEIDH